MMTTVLEHRGRTLLYVRHTLTKYRVDTEAVLRLTNDEVLKPLDVSGTELSLVYYLHQPFVPILGSLLSAYPS